MKKDAPIDLLLFWVDGTDARWQQEKAKWERKTQGDRYDAGARRYRDFGLLKYWFRGVEKQLPWFHRIVFVTNGQYPEWLKKDQERLLWVRHEDFLPREYLPTFSSNAIELNFHRIEGLAEQFIIFNDDMFVIRRLPPEHFFKDGLPVVNPRASLTVPSGFDDFAHLTLNNIMVINKHFRLKEVLKQDPGNWFYPWRIGLKEALINLSLLPAEHFYGLANPHMPSPVLKSTYEELWQAEPELLEQTSSHRFRSTSDVNQYLLTDWQIAKNACHPICRRKLGTYYPCDIRNVGQIASDIRKQQTPMICINDTADELDEEAYEFIQKTLAEAFETIYPEKSIFEK